MSLGLEGLTAGTIHVSLENASGTVLAAGTAGAANLSEAISNFSVPAAGTYYAHLTAFQSNVNVTQPVSYSLVVTRNASFDAEPNDSLATAQRPSIRSRWIWLPTTTMTRDF